MSDPGALAKRECRFYTFLNVGKRPVAASRFLMESFAI